MRTFAYSQTLIAGAGDNATMFANPHDLPVPMMSQGVTHQLRARTDLDSARATVRLIAAFALAFAPLAVAETTTGTTAPAGGLTHAPSAAQADILPDATAFAGWLAGSEKPVAIVMFSLPECGFCRIVRRTQLAPLLRDPAYADVAIFELDMHDATTVLPMAGALLPDTHTTPARLARQWKTRLSPTLHFVTHDRVAAEPLIGYAGPDFYWAYLNERIESARRAATQ